MNATQPSRWDRHVRPHDAIGIAQLAAHATSEVMTVTEQLHLSILTASGITPDSRLGWLHRGTQLLYSGLKIAPKTTAFLLRPIAKRVTPSEQDESQGRRQTLAALNGVFGDQLESNHNPLATVFSCEVPFKPTSALLPTQRIYFLHGLCMEETAWQHPQIITPLNQPGIELVFVRYNSGLTIAENAEKLVDAMARHYQPGDTISLVGHSMGGLIAHQALHEAVNQHRGFATNIRSLICVGSPHLGAPMAKLGHWLESLMHRNPFTRPFTYVTRLRSAGIKDLQHGYYSDTTFPSTARYCIAGELPEKYAQLKEQLGDGLVTETSALAITDAEKCVIKNVSHLGLLSDERVLQKVVSWLQN